MAARREQRRIACPSLPNPLPDGYLKQHLTPWPDEIEWAFNATWSEETRLGLLTLLKVFETLGRFIPPEEIPLEIIRHIAQSTGLAERDTLVYPARTLYRRHRAVREFLGISEWDSRARQFAEGLMEQLARIRSQPSDLINAAIEALVRERFELPALATLRRMAGTVQQRIHDHMFREVERSLTTADGVTLDALLEVPIAE